ncbi:MAG: hypothetical protein HXX08_12845 [Chloroflexi bacterium]|uniref:Uncharacterized protein n=1 Tax=Candidatus Chlorohelix allophototropha TaxID=3003348 RepID=A0A8T7M3U3_9CHLR|nr:hypothetical protein [Chloroflexota bacterium]WJW69977.1 hypothetical protein OZ401_004778 [Chloroflexota bacterium L227-S17]
MPDKIPEPISIPGNVFRSAAESHEENLISAIEELQSDSVHQPADDSFAWLLEAASSNKLFRQLADELKVIFNGEPRFQELFYGTVTGFRQVLEGAAQRRHGEGTGLATIDEGRAAQ